MNVDGALRRGAGVAAPRVVGALVLAAALVVAAATAAGADGYWMATAGGGVGAFGSARDFGSVDGAALRRPITCVVSTPSGQGYWLLASDGGVFSFGDAAFLGSTGDRTLNRPIVGMAATPSGRGYWLVASDGGVFSFGDAAFLGSTGDEVLNRPIVGLAPTASGAGYRLAASDGGVFTFGDATFEGSDAAEPFSTQTIGLSRVGGAAGCAPPSPLASRVVDAASYAAGRQGEVGIAAIDLRTGEYAGGGAAMTSMRSASVVKVIIGMALFAQAERQGRELTSTEQADLSSMIRVSDNDAATRLWNELGGTNVISWIRQATGVRDIAAAADGSWGFTAITAHGMAVVLADLDQGHAITASHRDALLGEMQNVIPAQRWGVAAAVNHSVPAVKNGWYPDDDAPVWRVHCTGIVADGPDGRRWVVVVTTRYPQGLGQAYGHETCQQVAQRVLPPGV